MLGSYCFDIDQGGLINGRSVKRNTRRCGGVEVWRWMHLHHSDFYYRVLGAGIRALLVTRILRICKRRFTRIHPCKSCLTNPSDPCYQLTTSSSASCHTGRFCRIAQRYNCSGSLSRIPAPIATVLIGSSGIVARSFNSLCKRFFNHFSNEPPPVRIIPE